AERGANPARPDLLLLVPRRVLARFGLLAAGILLSAPAARDPLRQPAEGANGRAQRVHVGVELVEGHEQSLERVGHPREPGLEALERLGHAREVTLNL